MQKNTYSSTSTKQRHHVSGTGCSKLFVGASGTSSNTETAKVQAQLIIILYIYIYIIKEEIARILREAVRKYNFI